MDEDALDKDLVSALRARAVDVLTAHEAGFIGRSDSDHLAFAAQSRRVLFGFNIGDYYQLHSDWVAAGRMHAGLVLARQQHDSVANSCAGS